MSNEKGLYMARRSFMRPAASFVLCLAFCTVTAQADFSTHPLDGHASAISGFTGHTDFLGIGVAHTLNIRVDYAVFAPGVFSGLGGSFTPFGAMPALDPSHYVYAYQIYNNGPLNAQVNSGNAELSQLGIDFQDNSVASLGYDPGFDASGSDVSATFAAILSDSFLYKFLTPRLAPDSFSVVLLMSSGIGPGFQPASVLNGGTSAAGVLPSPIPAPSAVLLGVLGIAAVTIRKRLPA
ncbi:MAG: hypothetical protein AMXMBFR13_39980 [Phycisphaerae bacterium]